MVSIHRGASSSAIPRRGSQRWPSASFSMLISLILFKTCSKCMKQNPVTPKSHHVEWFLCFYHVSTHIFQVKFPKSYLASTVDIITWSQCIHSYARAYLWLLSLPGMRSPVGSIGDGRRLRHEVKDWLESSLDTGHIGKQLAVNSQKNVHIFKWLA